MGLNQHGFKRNRSTSFLTVELLSMIARAVNDDENVIVFSIDLSSDLDLVNIDLFLKSLKIIGSPEDLIDLISAWLRNRLYYVSIYGANSTYSDRLLGTVQGSILGPILYAIFTSPLFDIEDMFAFADNKFSQRSYCSLPMLIKETEQALGAMTKPMKNSGLKLNRDKTVACLFFKKDCIPIRIKSGNDTNSTKIA
jgi:hypothetical protein